MAFTFRANNGDKWFHDFPKLARDSGFHFNMRRNIVRVNWNRIGEIDIDRVIQEKDFYTIDQNINNVIDYQLESEYDVKILDQNFVKLFRLAQLSVEYLLYCKQYLDYSIVILKEELKSKLDENSKLKKELQITNESFTVFKDKQKYSEQKKNNDSQGEIYKCPYCPKAFLSAIFTNSHINRRHSNLPQLPHQLIMSSHYHYDECNRTEAEKLQDEIKNLKERLNQTERIIRTTEFGNMSESSAEFKGKYNNNNNNSNNNHSNNDNEDIDVIRKDKVEEEQRKYRDEISQQLTTMLVSEIRNLREDDKKSNLNNDHENDMENLRQLLKQQEIEMQCLRNQIQELSEKKSSSESISEIIQIKLSSQEEFWQSKIDQLELHHTKDIEELSNQLKLTQEAAEAMRNDYIIKMKELECEKERLSKSNEDSNNLNVMGFINMNSAFQHNNQRLSGGADENIYNMEDVEKGSNSHVDDNNLTTHSFHYRKPFKADAEKNYQKKSTKSEQKYNSQNDDNNIINQRPVTARTEDKLIDKRNLGSDSSKKSHIDKLVVSSSYSCHRVDNKESQDDETSVTDSELSSEFTQSSTNKQDDIEDSPASVSEDSSEYTESEEKSVAPRSKNIELNRMREEINKEVISALDQKLADLGINPDIDGVSKDTYKRLMTIVKHHRSVNSKKFSKFQDIRRNIMRIINQKFPKKCSERFQVSSTRTPVKQASPSPFNPQKIVSSFKPKAIIKALSSPNVHGSPRIQDRKTSQMAAKLKTRRHSLGVKADNETSNESLLPKKMTQRELHQLRSSMQSQSFRLSRDDKQESSPINTPSSRKARVNVVSKMVTSTPSVPVRGNDYFKRSFSSEENTNSLQQKLQIERPTSSLNTRKKKVLFDLEKKGILKNNDKVEEIDDDKGNEEEEDKETKTSQQIGNELNKNKSYDCDELSLSSITDEEKKCFIGYRNNCSTQHKKKLSDSTAKLQRSQSEKINAVTKLFKDKLNETFINKPENDEVINNDDDDDDNDDDDDDEHDEKNEWKTGSFLMTYDNVVTHIKSSKPPQPAPRTLGNSSMLPDDLKLTVQKNSIAN